MGSSRVELSSFLHLFVTVTLGLRHWFWALSCPLPRELDHNDISGTIEDTNGAFTGLENLSKLWVSLGLNSASQFCCVPVWGWVCPFLCSLPHLGTRQKSTENLGCSSFAGSLQECECDFQVLFLSRYETIISFLNGEQTVLRTAVQTEKFKLFSCIKLSTTIPHF